MNGLVPWRTRGALTGFRREMDNLFDRFLERWYLERFGGDAGWVPSMDVSESAKEVIVKTEIPGMDPKDIDLSVHGDVLTVSGERKKEEKEKGENFHRLETSYGSFSRSVQLPAEVDANKVKAVYKDGILKINLSKTKATSAKKITVKPG